MVRPRDPKTKVESGRRYVRCAQTLFASYEALFLFFSAQSHLQLSEQLPTNDYLCTTSYSAVRVRRNRILRAAGRDMHGGSWNSVPRLAFLRVKCSRSTRSNVPLMNWASKGRFQTIRVVASRNHPRHICGIRSIDSVVEMQIDVQARRG
jgi:hypothetical protein